MKRSRFFPAICNCQQTAQEIFAVCKDAAAFASLQLGPGHRENAYEQVMLNYFYARRIPTLRQVKYYSTVANQVIETGIVDLELDKCVLLELKSGYNTITDDHKIQLQRYMKSAREKYPHEFLIGAVILFTKHGGVLHWKIQTPSVPTLVSYSPVLTSNQPDTETKNMAKQDLCCAQEKNVHTNPHH